MVFLVHCSLLPSSVMNKHRSEKRKRQLRSAVSSQAVLGLACHRLQGWLQIKNWSDWEKVLTVLHPLQPSHFIDLHAIVLLFGSKIGMVVEPKWKNPFTHSLICTAPFLQCRFIFVKGEPDLLGHYIFVEEMCMGRKWWGSGNKSSGSENYHTHTHTQYLIISSNFCGFPLFNFFPLGCKTDPKERACFQVVLVDQYRNFSFFIFLSSVSSSEGRITISLRLRWDYQSSSSERRKFFRRERLFFLPSQN